MEDIDSVYKEAKKLTITLQSQIEMLEKDRSVVIQSKISFNTNLLANTVAKLQNLVNGLPTSKKEYWAIKVEQLALENKRIKEEIQTYFYHIHAQNQQEERMQDLHQRRIQTQHQMYAQNANQAMKDTSDSLTRSQQVANEVMDMLGNVKMAVFEQNHQLKRVRRRVREVMGQFELSKSLLNMIERRSKLDSIILFGGMFAIILFLFVWWFWFSSSPHSIPHHAVLSHQGV